MRAFVRWICIAMSAVLLASGCRSVSATHTHDAGAPRFAASDPTEVEILQEVPARPHVKLGEVWVHCSANGGDGSKLEEALRNEAAKLGADAVVVWQDKIEGTGSPHGQTIVGAAIKYP